MVTMATAPRTDAGAFSIFKLYYIFGFHRIFYLLLKHKLPMTEIESSDKEARVWIKEQRTLRQSTLSDQLNQAPQWVLWSRSELTQEHKIPARWEEASSLFTSVMFGTQTHSKWTLFPICLTFYVCYCLHHRRCKFKNMCICIYVYK